MSATGDMARLIVFGVLIGSGAGYFVAYYPDKLPSLSSFTSLGSRLGLVPSCNIKGNVSINSGERIYHVPGQKFYNETLIRWSYGERWFCTEQEARAAGWRKAHR